MRRPSDFVGGLMMPRVETIPADRVRLGWTFRNSKGVQQPLVVVIEVVP